MHTIQLDIKDDKLDIFLTIIKNLKDDIVENIRTKEDMLDIESVELNSADYIDMQNIKKQNNKKTQHQRSKNNTRSLVKIQIDDKAIKDLSNTITR